MPEILIADTSAFKNFKIFGKGFGVFSTRMWKMKKCQGIFPEG